MSKKQAKNKVIDQKKRKVFVGGISKATTEAMLRDYFSQFGTVHRTVINREHYTDKSRGSGFVLFECCDSVKKVLDYPEKHVIDSKEFDCQPCLLQDKIEKMKEQQEKKSEKSGRTHTNRRQSFTSSTKGSHVSLAREMTASRNTRDHRNHLSHSHSHSHHSRSSQELSLGEMQEADFRMGMGMKYGPGSGAAHHHHPHHRRNNSGGHRHPHPHGHYPHHHQYPEAHSSDRGFDMERYFEGSPNSSTLNEGRRAPAPVYHWSGYDSYDREGRDREEAHLRRSSSRQYQKGRVGGFGQQGGRRRPVYRKSSSGYFTEQQPPCHFEDSYSPEGSQWNDFGDHTHSPREESRGGLLLSEMENGHGHHHRRHHHHSHHLTSNPKFNNFTHQDPAMSISSGHGRNLPPRVDTPCYDAGLFTEETRGHDSTAATDPNLCHMHMGSYAHLHHLQRPLPLFTECGERAADWCWGTHDDVCLSEDFESGARTARVARPRSVAGTNYVLNVCGSGRKEEYFPTEEVEESLARYQEEEVYAHQREGTSSMIIGKEGVRYVDMRR